MEHIAIRDFVHVKIIQNGMDPMHVSLFLAIRTRQPQGPVPIQAICVLLESANPLPVRGTPFLTGVRLASRTPEHRHPPIVSFNNFQNGEIPALR